MKVSRTKILLATSILPQILLIRVISLYPEKVEFYFSQTFYPFLFNLQHVFIKPIPFSFGDLLYLSLGIYICFSITRFLLKFRFPKIIDIIDIGIFFSLLFLLFQLNWGINYHRTPLAEKLPTKKQYSDSLLIDLTTRFAIMSNTLHSMLSSLDTLAVSIPYAKKEIAKRIQSSYDDLWISTVDVPQVKASLFSLPLSYMGYAGYLNPFTLEAQVNMRMPKINLPITIAHEMAHQLGYAAENEANFVGFINTFNNADPYLKYAAVLFGFRHCYSDLIKRDPDQAKILVQQLNLGILKNFAESRNFREEYKNPFEPFFKESYDAYLKANGQESGIKTYNQMVAFLIAYDLQNKFKF
ncbi:DUF3810 domain-containing protein [Flavobacteriaceae bacterium]|nr:DUF3810 domain-containing protein [Flavobacteriaceae bacterium]